MNRAIAIFGGTFDPVHYGHLRAAAEVADKLQVDDFRLLPAGTPPHRDATWAKPEHRLAMLELALRDHPDLRVDDREIRRPGRSYMVDTLDSIRREAGNCPVLLIIGQDAANALDQWHRWRELFELAHLVIMTRPKSRPRYRPELAEVLQPRRVRGARALMDAPAGGVLHVEVTRLAISSTDIRRQLEAGANPRFLLPAPVLKYIRKQRLYNAYRSNHNR